MTLASRRWPPARITSTTKCLKISLNRLLIRCCVSSMIPGLLVTSLQFGLKLPSYQSPNRERIPLTLGTTDLTSCLGKTFERLVSCRLVWFLENNKYLTEYQSGFRKSRSTTDQLVRLESYIREAFVRREDVVSVCVL